MRPKVILHRRSITDVDPEFGATGVIEWLDPVELYGQVRYERYEQLVPVNDGNDPVNDGHIVFYAEDWQNSGGTVGDELELEDSSRQVKPPCSRRARYARDQQAAARV